MQAVVLLLLAAVVAGCGSPAPAARVERYGISIQAQDGWKATISRGLVRVARGDVSVELYEYDPSNAVEATHFDGEWPVTLQAREFDRRDDEQERLVSVSERFFTVFAFGRPTQDEIAEINSTLATVEVEPGDYFPGSVAPIKFARRAGWEVGVAEDAERRPQGEFVTAWAATAPYKDGPDAFPRETLTALPANGIVVWVMLSRGGRSTLSRTPENAPPYRLRDLVRRDNWEGQIRDLPEHVLWVRYGERYLVDLRLYFGRPDPTPAMLAQADAMLAGLRFPDWGPWELEPA